MSLRVSTTGIEIDGGTTLYVQDGNQKQGRILTSGSNGLVRWTEPSSIYGKGHYVGELYGGGIVVKVWEDGGEENVMIASLSDISFFVSPTVQSFTPNWMPDGTQTSLSNASSTHNGGTNFDLMNLQWETYLTQYPPPLGLGPSLISLSGTTINGYSDWYPPSLYEMNVIAENAGVINKILGEGNMQMGPRNANAIYWTSTEIDSTNAWSLDMSEGPKFQSRSKTNTARLRPIRIERNISGEGLIFSLDMSKKKSYNDIFRTNKVADLVNIGTTSSYAYTIGSGATYSSENDGILRLSGANTTSRTTVDIPIGNSNVATIEMWIKISSSQSPNNTGTYTLFSWVNNSEVGFYNIAYYNNRLGFQTNNIDLRGLTSTDSSDILDKWTHLAFVMVESAPIDNLIYINGQAVPFGIDWINEGSVSTGNAIFHSGKAIIGGNYQSNFYNVKADISLVRVYNRQLNHSEIQMNYDSRKRKYDIGIPNTHSIQNIPINPATFSVVQNLSIRTTGMRNERILRSSVDGTATWVDRNYMTNRPINEMEIGETYGGGIIVSKWKYPTNINRYLIMSKEDISSGIPWSNVTRNNTIKFAGSANNSIYAIAVQSDGKILIGGAFTQYAGVSRGRIARLNKDGSLDTTFTPSFNNVVYTIAVQTDGEILVGGLFTQYTAPNGTTSTVINITRLTSTGAQSATFTTGSGYGLYISSNPAFVNDIKVQSDGKILVGGNFDRHKYNSTDNLSSRIVRLNSNGTYDSTFSIGTGFTGASTTVKKIAIQSDGKILVGGYFTSFNGTTRNCIARLNSNGSLDTGFTSGAINSTGEFGIENIVVQPDGKIIIGGYLQQYLSGVTTYTINGFARLNSNGTIDTGFGYFPGVLPNYSQMFMVTRLSDGRILFGTGDFASYNGIAVASAAIVSSSGVKDSSTLSLNSSPITAVVHPDGFVIMGGDFTTFNSNSSPYLVAFYPNTTDASSDIASNRNDDFRGATNSQFIIAQAGHTQSAAKLCSEYRGGGYSDWYLPSISELKQAFNELSAIGYVVGTQSGGNYWSSTHFSRSTSDYALSLDFSATTSSPGTQIPELKTKLNKVRAFREVAQTAKYVTWTNTNPWDDPSLDWEAIPGSESTWSTHKGITTTNLKFHFNGYNKLSYNGYRGTASNLANPANIGTILSGVTFSTDFNAMFLNGTISNTTLTADSYIDFGTTVPASTPTSAPYTMEAWVYPTYGTASQDALRTIFTIGAVPTYNSTYTGLELGLSRNPNNTDKYNILCQFGNGGGAGYQYRKTMRTSDYPLSKGQWYHIVCVISVLDPFDSEIFINGESYLKYSDIQFDINQQSIYGTATTISIPIGSKSIIGQATNTKRVFGGMISVCRFYTAALTPDQIKDNFEAERKRHGV